MTSLSKVGALICSLAIVPSVGNADGVGAVYTPDGQFIATIEVLGDITMPSGEPYALLEMTSEHMRFYVDPDAIYVELDTGNPILTQQTPFRGFWLDGRTIDNTNWPACQTPAFDEFGAAYHAHGSLVWTNTGLADDGFGLEFAIQLGTCDAKPQDWGVSGAAFDAGVQSVAPVGQLTDANDTRFVVQISKDRTALEAVSGTESLVIHGNCTAYARQHGWGTWGWANGGFVIAFDAADFSFPRQDAPIENGGACRL